MRTYPGVTRRAVLVGIAVGAVAACTDPEPPPPPDPLSALLVRAEADKALAAAVAAAVPALKASAGEVARVRGDHAAALRAEVERERPPAPSSTTAPPPAPPKAPADAAAAKKALVQALTKAQEEATALVASLPRHRAGMVGSVVAACASLREVL
ncbi:hypothetical protein ACFPM7_19885 [Actinokineospora guangxiensis]|uniref:Uncharacterized protein n=1 Tax=Actinokineospora guangxiensis TaxID=1490288 RepID=A0ABW0ET69_9PSEU